MNEPYKNRVKVFCLDCFGPVDHVVEAVGKDAWGISHGPGLMGRGFLGCINHKMKLKTHLLPNCRLRTSVILIGFRLGARTTRVIPYVALKFCGSLNLKIF